MKLSEEMQRAVAFAKEHGGKLHRHQGGFWSHPEFKQWQDKWFGTSTVEALVKRGAGTYTAHKERGGDRGSFPVEFTVTLQS